MTPKRQSQVEPLQASCNPAAEESTSTEHAVPAHAQWFVVETLPQNETRAIENLRRQSFEVFFPRFRKLRSHARKKEIVLAPVFPGYVFVRLNIEADPWPSINSTRGVKRLVRFHGSRPQSVDPDAMRAILERCNNGIMIHVAEKLTPGDRVKINAGPLANLIATVESLDKKGRINLLFQIMGGDQVVNVARSAVRPEFS